MYDAVKTLLENGADPNRPSFTTYTPGAGNQSETRIKSNIETVCYPKYDIKYLKLLVSYGANVNDTANCAPLIKAMLGDQEDKINFLLKNGADVNLKANRGLPPILDAAMSDRWDLVEYFLNIGGNIHIEYEGISLQKEMQESINKSEGNPRNKEVKRRIIRRMQDTGIELNFSHAKFL